MEGVWRVLGEMFRGGMAGCIVEKVARNLRDGRVFDVEGEEVQRRILLVHDQRQQLLEVCGRWVRKWKEISMGMKC